MIPVTRAIRACWKSTDIYIIYICFCLLNMFYLRPTHTHTHVKCAIISSTSMLCLCQLEVAFESLWSFKNEAKLMIRFTVTSFHLGARRWAVDLLWITLTALCSRKQNPLLCSELPLNSGAFFHTASLQLFRSRSLDPSTHRSPHNNRMIRAGWKVWQAAHICSRTTVPRAPASSAPFTYITPVVPVGQDPAHTKCSLY